MPRLDQIHATCVSLYCGGVLASHQMTALRIPTFPANLLLCFAASLLLPSASLKAEPADTPPIHQNKQIAAIMTELGRARGIQRTAVSPDGKMIAWASTGAKANQEISLAPVANTSAVRKITASDARSASCNEGEIAFSPDSASLAYLSDCQSPGQQEVFLTTLASPNTKSRRLSHLHGFVDSLAWSPNGKIIGFLYVEGATRHAGALAAMKPPSGVIGEDGIEIQRVASIDITSEHFAQLTPAKLHVYEFDWAPDSHQLAYVAATPPGDNNWWVAQLYSQAVDGPPHSILDPDHIDTELHGLQIAVPRWSPDSNSIAFIGGLMSDQGSTGGDIYLIPSDGGTPRNLTPGRATSPTWLQWLGPNRLFFTETAGGNSRVGSLETEGGGALTVTSPYAILPQPALDLPESIGDGRLELSVSVHKNSDVVAFIRSSWAMPPEVWLWKPHDSAQPLQQITHLNDSLKPAWGKAESLRWKSESYQVQGWLLYPVNYDPSKKYPLIVSVHGGPASVLQPAWPGVGYNATAFSALGYFVLFPNPRGSYGQGEAFTAANRKDFGYGDLRDILAGVDTVSAKFPIDQQRIGLTGWSYGGFTTMFAVTQTNRFRAAVAGAGISDWQSYYGENSIDQWMVPYFGASVYDDPAVYAKSSAINFIHNTHTPTLAVVGDRDGECPAPQSFEFWHALRAQHVPTQLVIYPDEGHSFASIEHRRDVLDRALNWFEKYMPAQP